MPTRGNWALAGKRVRGVDDSVPKEYVLFCHHSLGFEDFSNLTINSNNFKVMLMESLLINKNHPSLNGNKQTLPWNF